MAKDTTSIRIDGEVLAKAREARLNVSKICEKALFDYLEIDKKTKEKDPEKLKLLVETHFPAIQNWQKVTPMNIINIKKALSNLGYHYSTFEVESVIKEKGIQVI